MKSEMILILLLAVMGATYWITNGINDTEHLNGEVQRLNYELEKEKIKSDSYRNGVKDSN